MLTQGLSTKRHAHTYHKTVAVLGAISHLLRIVLLIIVIIVIILVLRVLLLLLRLLRIILLLLLRLLHLIQVFPFLCKTVGLSLVVTDDDIVEDRATLDLPQVEAKEAKVCKLVNRIIILVLWICNLLCFPDSLVCRIRDSLAVPFALEFRVVLHRCFPLSILLIIPVIWLLSLTVHNPLLCHPIIWLLILRIVNHRIIRPIIRLLVFRVRDLLWLQHLPIILDGALVDLFLIDLPH